MRIWKAHSLGNDYLVWEGEAGFLTPERVQKICDRNYGVGGDGILEPMPWKYDPQQLHSHRPGVIFGLRIWNPDGSIAEKSGNGIRIFAYWLRHRCDVPQAKALLPKDYVRRPGPPGVGLEAFLQKPSHIKGIVPTNYNYKIDTGYELAEATVFPGDTNWPSRSDHWQFPPMVRVDMGPPRFSPDDIPCAEKIWGQSCVVDGTELKLWAAGMGNPHCVSFFPPETDLDSLQWRNWGKLLERDPRFPNRTNVQFARVLNTETIDVRIWERGAGETEASGSSASAVFAVAYAMGWVNSSASVQMPGGNLRLQQVENGHIYNSGPVTPVAEISIFNQLF